MKKRMARMAVLGMAVSLALGLAANASAQETKPLYQTMMQANPAPKLKDVSGREFKFLIDVSKTAPKADDAFKDLWDKVKLAAAKRGFAVTEKDKNPLKVEFSTKEYFDTSDQALWKKGYLVRLTQKYKDGAPDAKIGVTIKAIHDDINKTLATPLVAAGVDKAKTEAEENIGFIPGGRLAGYVEKGTSFNIAPAALGKMTLGDLGKYLPELLTLGLPADTALIGKKAYSYRVKPGAVVLPGTEPCGVSMEAWAATEGGAPVLFDFSFGYGDIDYYAAGGTHEAGENFMYAVMRDELGALGGNDWDKWGGSKVRKWMNRPVAK